MLCWSEGGISKLAKKLGMRHTRMMDSFHESQCISKMSVDILSKLTKCLATKNKTELK